MIQRACECGATVKVADVDGRTEYAVLKAWDQIHAPHEAVRPHEATRIREAARREAS